MAAPQLERGIVQATEPLAPDHNGHTLFLPDQPIPGEHSLFLPEGVKRRRRAPASQIIEEVLVPFEEQGENLLWQRRKETPLDGFYNQYGSPLLLPSEAEYKVQLPDPLKDPKGFVDAIEKLEPGADTSSRRIAVPEDDLDLGLKIAKIYENALTRELPWLIKGNRITLGARTLVRSMDEVGMQSFIRPKEGQVDVLIDEALQQETISLEFAKVLEQFVFVEAHLNNFMASGGKLYEFYLGFSQSFPQWGREEDQHSRAIRRIIQYAKVKETGEPYKTQEKLDQDLKDSVRSTWEQPFPTVRQIVVYAYLQEEQTKLQYENLVKRAMDEGAPTAALLLNLVMHDEAYHHGGYRRYVEELLKHDTIGTIRDIMYVAMNYEMPLVKVLGRRALLEIAQSKIFNEELLVQGTIQNSIKVLKFPDRVTSKDPEQHNEPIPADYAKSIAYLAAEKYAIKHNYKARPAA